MTAGLQDNNAGAGERHAEGWRNVRRFTHSPPALQWLMVAALLGLGAMAPIRCAADLFTGK